MKLFLIAYANAAIVVPAVWVGARLWRRRHSRTTAPSLISAQSIAFPGAMRGLKLKARARAGNRMDSGSRAVNEGACRKPTSTSRRDDVH